MSAATSPMADDDTDWDAAFIIEGSFFYPPLAVSYCNDLTLKV